MRLAFACLLCLTGCVAEVKTQQDIIEAQAKLKPPIEYNGEFLDVAAKEFSVRVEGIQQDITDTLNRK